MRGALAAAALSSSLMFSGFAMAQDEPHIALSPKLRSLSAQLAESDPQERAKAISGLAETKDPKVVSLIVGRLADDDSDVRFAAVSALGEMGDPSAVIPLIKRLADTDESVRYAAVESLGKLGDAKALGPIAERLRKDDDRKVRRVAADTLGKMKDRRSVEPLTAQLRPEKEGDAEVRLAIVSALKAINDPKAAPALRRAAARDPDEWVRKRAGEAASKLH